MSNIAGEETDDPSSIYKTSLKTIEKKTKNNS